MRRKLTTLLAAAGLLVGMFSVLFLSGVRTEAAGTEYKKLFTEKEEQKVGGTWFRRSGSAVYYSRNGSDYKLITEGYFIFFTDGRTVLYVDSSSEKQKLMSFSCTDGRKKTLKNMPVVHRQNDQDYFSVATVYGKNVYITQSSFEAWNFWTYKFNLKTKSWKKILSGGCISAYDRPYVVVTHEYRSDVSPARMSLYKLTSSGMKKVRLLAKACHTAVFVKGKVYYSSYPGKTMKKATIYRADRNGKNTKKLGTFTSTQEYGQVIPYQFTSTYCIVNIDGANYKYVYKTKKLTKIS